MTWETAGLDVVMGGGPHSSPTQPLKEVICTMNKGKHIDHAPEGFFEFTVPQETRRRLKKWEAWFKAIGIPTKVVVHENGGFILCRKGKDAFAEGVLYS